MSSPMAIQPMKRSHVSSGCFVIRYTQSAAPIGHRASANGTLKPRSSSGRVRRSTSTPMFTRKKANSVPMLTSSAIVVSGTNAAMIAISPAKRTVVKTGVWRLETEASFSGTSPSRDIANMIRVWP